MNSISCLSASDLELLDERARALGFDHVGVSPLRIPEVDRAAYESWCDEGSASGMEYMTRNRAARMNPAAAFPEARSVLTLGVSYFQGPFPEKPGLAYGRVARYAWGEDYHPVILARLHQLAQEIVSRGVRFALPAVDTKPILERALARQSGEGFVGKNTVFIVPGRPNGFHVGSWLFLAEILLDCEVPEGPRPVSLSACGGCTKCLDVCPTEAFDGPYRLKSDRCISYLTIENKGEIPFSMRDRLTDWIFGCDLCQEVCPFNARAKKSRWPELEASRGVGPWISLSEILAVKTAREFEGRWGKTPLARAKRRGLLRNACVAAGNSAEESLGPVLEPLLQDPEPLLRGHALWALHRLRPTRARRLAETVLRNETDAGVQDECRRILAA